MTTPVKPNHDGNVWIHFPQIAGTGCEGVLILYALPRCYRVVLVDGSADQVQLLQAWSAASRKGGTVHLEIVWVISHFHRDHYGEGCKLMSNPHIGNDLQEIFFPEALGVAPSFPDQEATSLKEAGPRLQEIYKAALRKDGMLPRCYTVPLGRILPIDDDYHVRVDVHGGPDRSHPRGLNTRSLIVMGFLQNGANQDNPFTFVLPGDAEPRTWDQFASILDKNSNLNAKLPIAILKLAHHGAENCNPEKVLQRLFAPNAVPGSTPMAVRILNRSRSPSNATGLETTLQKLKIPVHDTRQDGELWVALRRGASLTKAAKRSDAALGLPMFFQQ